MTKDDIKEVIANVSQLKYELQTNKELIPLNGNGNVISHFEFNELIYLIWKWTWVICMFPMLLLLLLLLAVFIEVNEP